MARKIFLLCSLLTLCFLLAGPAQASVYYRTNTIALYVDEPVPDWTVIDLSQFSGNFTETNGPLQIGTNVGEDVVWQSYVPGSPNESSFSLNPLGPIDEDPGQSPLLDPRPDLPGNLSPPNPPQGGIQTTPTSNPS